MRARTIKGLFVMGVADLAYRLFLRGPLRRRIGIEAHPSVLPLPRLRES
jgi:hypothetical protein